MLFIHFTIVILLVTKWIVLLVQHICLFNPSFAPTVEKDKVSKFIVSCLSLWGKCLKYSALKLRNYKNINPLSARIFTTFGQSLLEDRMLHKEAWVAKLLGTHLSIQVHKKVKFSWHDNLPSALKWLKIEYSHAWKE